jgi:LmbE family N-acetylglucosaminyl deacetylase
VKIFIAPHNDDEVLFGCFTLLREKPLVVNCLRCDSQVDPAHGAPFHVRERESAAALDILRVPHAQWNIPETNPDWDYMLRSFQEMRSRGLTAAWIPKVEPEGGHPHHDKIGRLALSVWPGATQYCTYSLAGKTLGVEVPFLPRWLPLKLRALACYESQAGGLNCHKYFIRDQREYVAE